MSQWQQLGFVRDSDEEDESQPTNLENYSLLSSFNSVPENTRLEHSTTHNDDLSTPLPTVATTNNALGSNIHNVNENSDAGSAPLSSPPSSSLSLPDVSWLLNDENPSIPLSPVRPAQSIGFRQPYVSPILEPVNVRNIPATSDQTWPPLMREDDTPMREAVTQMGEDDALVREDEAFAARLGQELNSAAPVDGRRWRFRNRTALQLHPYILERQQYLQSMRGRGVAPADVGRDAVASLPQARAPPSRIRPVNDADTQNPARRRSLSFSSSSTSMRSNTSPRISVDLGSFTPDRDDNKDPGSDNESLFSYLSDSPLKSANRTSSPSMGRNDALRSSDLESLPDLNLLLTTTTNRPHVRKRNREARLGKTDHPRAVSNALSEGLAPSPKKQKVRKKFRVPAEFRPSKNRSGRERSFPDPIPSISGSLQSRRSPFLGVSSGSDTETLERRYRQNSESGADEGSDDSIELTHFRKKSDGILPPSWICLDGQLDSLADHEMMGLPSARSSSAFPLSTNREFQNRDELDIIADPESSDVEMGAFVQSRKTGASKGDSTFGDPMLLDDDFASLDVLVAPKRTIRSSKPVKRPRNRQIKIADAFLRTSQSKNKRAGPSLSTPRLKRGNKAIQKPPKLGILDVDAQQLCSSATGRIPAFIRIAQRQARRSSTLGRSSPDGKIIRLERDSDTQEALAVLHQWKSGGIPRRHGIRQRQPKIISDAGSFGLAHHRLPSRPSRSQPALALRQPSMKEVFGLGHNAPSSTKPASRPRLVQSKSTTKSRAPPNPRNGSTIYRTGQLEAPEPTLPSEMNLFQENLHVINSKFNDRLLTDPLMKSKVHQYLSDGRNEVGIESAPLENIFRVQEIPGKKSLPRVSSRRKPNARRMEVSLREFRQPSDPPPELPPMPEFVNSQAAVPNLVGLRNPWDSYPVTFDVQTLGTGLFFSTATFIGSSKFRHCLDLSGRDFHQVSTPLEVSIHSGQAFLGPWNHYSRSLVLSIFEEVSKSFTAQGDSSTTYPHSSDRAVHDMEVIAVYLSRHMHFVDPADVASFATLPLNSLTSLFDQAVLFHQQNPSSTPDNFYLFLTVSICILHILYHLSTNSSTKIEIESLLRRFALLCIERSFQFDSSKLRTFLDNNRHFSAIEDGISNQEALVQALVVIFHISQQNTSCSWSIWSLFHEASQLLGTIDSVSHLERVWHKLFCLLPILEINSSGIYIPGSRFSMLIDNWATVRLISGRVFELYPTTSQASTAIPSNYAEAIIRRFYHLITFWGWWKCADVLKQVFDFFAKRHFANLRKQEAISPSNFLEDMVQGKVITPLPHDTAFTLFLKTLRVGMGELSKKQPAKTIRNTIWRFIPLHSRSYSKNKDVLQEDIDALKNHHDLFCTLYCVSPPEFRPKFSILRGLVDFPFSHINACLVNIRSWAALLQAQLSFKEGPAMLTDFADHFAHMISCLSTQYRLAHSEAEEQLKSMKGRQETIPESLIRTVMRKNQSQIASCVVAAIVGLRGGLSSLSSQQLDDASVMMKSFSLFSLYDLFDSRQHQIVDAVKETFMVVKVYAKLASEAKLSLPISFDIVNDSEESQEYGPWPTMEDIVAVDNPGVPTVTGETSDDSLTIAVLLQLEGDIFRALSNYFGSDSPPSDDFTVDMIRVWAVVSSTCVKWHIHDWAYYLDSYGVVSISHFPETDQTRPFYPLFFAEALDADHKALSNSPDLLLRIWITSLIERESRLRYQHILTSAILNSQLVHPLIENLPFAAAANGKFSISLGEFRERRFALIESILRNARMSSGYSGSDRDRQASQRNKQVRQIRLPSLTLMDGMKKRYDEISTMVTKSSPVFKGYVEFIHSIIQLLEQYSADFCPIDRFFLDDQSFPHPETDPDYQTGRLKGFSWTLDEEATQSKLTGFLFACIARSILEGKETNLARQFQVACSDYHTDEGSHLRTVIMYHFRLLLSSWLAGDPQDLLLRPIFPALEFIVADLYECLDFAIDLRSPQAILLFIQSLLSGFTDAAQRLIWGSGYLVQYVCNQGTSLRLWSVIAGFKLLQSLACLHGYISSSESPFGNPEHSERLVYLYHFAGNLLMDLQLQVAEHERSEGRPSPEVVKRPPFQPQISDWPLVFESMPPDSNGGNESLNGHTIANLHTRMGRYLHTQYNPTTRRAKFARDSRNRKYPHWDPYFGPRELGEAELAYTTGNSFQEAIVEIEKFRQICKLIWPSSSSQMQYSTFDKVHDLTNRVRKEEQSMHLLWSRDPIREFEGDEDEYPWMI